MIQAVSRQAKVVYVDNDPMVLAFANKLLTDDGTTAVIHADLRDPDSVLNAPELRALIDFSQPIGLLMTAVLHFVADGSDPWGLVARYVRALVPGSYLAVSHVTADNVPQRGLATGLAEYAKATENIYLRPRAEVERFFAGLELVPPTRTASRGWCSWANGAPKTRNSPTATGHGGVTAVLPGSRETAEEKL